MNEQEINDNDFRTESRNPNPESRRIHVPVMLREALEYLRVEPDGTYIDATLGTGGHAEEILKVLGRGKLLGIDCDPAALQVAREHLRPFEEKLIVLEGNFTELDALHAKSGLPPADGLLADLGVSSLQLEDPERGFSFNREGPLDMRMDPSTPVTAEALVNRMRERDLADLIFKFGEERLSRRIARALVKARPFRTTTELAQVVTRAIPSRAGLHQKIHPATRTFLALRLAVNRELENLETFLSKALAVLAPRGRCVVLSFHSLEDRLVKQAFRVWKSESKATILTRKPVRPALEEVRSNPRARSVKLRAAEKSRD